MFLSFPLILQNLALIVLLICSFIALEEITKKEAKQEMEADSKSFNIFDFNLLVVLHVMQTFRLLILLYINVYLKRNFRTLYLQRVGAYYKSHVATYLQWYDMLPQNPMNFSFSEAFSLRYDSSFM